MTDRTRERALFEYANALERGDFETVARILHMAETDAILDRMIAELQAAEEAALHPPDERPAPPDAQFKTRGIQINITFRNRFSPDGRPPKTDPDEEDNSMNAVIQPVNQRAQQYLTLAAALLVFVLLGGIALNMIPNQFFRPLTPRRVPALAPITPENADQLQIIGFLGRGQINDIAWSPDGRTLAMGSGNGMIWLYNPGDLNAEPDWLPGNSRTIFKLAFSADGKTLTSVGADSSIRLWDMETHTERFLIESRPANHLAFSADGKWVAVGGGLVDTTIWNTDDGQAIATFDGIARALALSPDGRILVTADIERQILIWDVQAQTLLATLEGHQAPINAIAFNPDGSMFASGDLDGSIRLWDWNGAAGSLGVRLSGHEKAIDELTFSKDGKTMASASVDGVIRLWNLDAGAEQAVLNGHRGRVGGLTFSPDSQTLASVGFDETLRLWDATAGVPIQLFPMTIGHVGGGFATFGPDGKTIVTGGDTTMQVWNATTLVQLAVMDNPGRAGCIAFSPDGTIVVTGDWDGKVRLWDLSSGTGRVLAEGIDPGVCVAYSPDGKTVASSGADWTARLIDVTTGESRILRHRGNVAGVSFSPDGKVLASGGTDDGVRLWDVATGDELSASPLTGIQGMSFPIFSPDGRLLAAGGTMSTDLNVHLFDTETYAERAVLPAYVSWAWPQFSPDGRLLVSAGGPDSETSAAGSVRIYEIETATQLRILTQYTSLTSLAYFSPDGTMIVSGADNGLIELWGVPTGE